jgi:4-hydroxy-tetrahydrodipicolinate reductase
MNIALIGYGKMGKTIERLALEAGHQVVLCIDRGDEALLQPEQLSRAEVAIEFSRPETAPDNLLACFRAGVPVVCGTTGWLERQAEIQEACRQAGGAFFYASNFSIGVNLFFELNRYLARLMNGQPAYTPSLEESHHVHKLDAPSGTAITLAQGLLQELDRKTRWALGPSEEPEVLSVVSHRIDEVPGTHELRWDSPEDSIRIEHVAHGREGFARGALRAAEWLRGRQGCFTMSDLLGF